ncbi:hypothetical protein [Celeribacter litoreus]|uniref:hypothetical protein n=1 Tax=Celeribacter litoreus TaxID=2876714 RepID=UPI001CCC519B|nr:hypothetical protein [Celeribacter litoreus]MCA0043627.1 hypothetical protein [Celeribacter litoreus]
MTIFQWGRRLLAGAILAFPLAAAPPAQAETVIGSNIDSRVLLGFEVEGAKLQDMMPEGWTAVSFPSGPTQGVTLLLSLEDRFLARDADGAPRPEWNSRTVALLALGKGEAGVRLFVLKAYSSLEGEGFFGNATSASVLRHTETDGPASGARSRVEQWSAVTATGEALTVDLAFQSGRPVWGERELAVYSNIDPDRVVLNAYEQLVDVAMSAAMGKPLDGTLSMTNTLPEWADVFDGSERLRVVMDIPVYVRTQMLP